MLKSRNKLLHLQVIDINRSGTLSLLLTIFLVSVVFLHQRQTKSKTIRQTMVFAT